MYFKLLNSKCFLTTLCLTTLSFAHTQPCPALQNSAAHEQRENVNDAPANWTPVVIRPCFAPRPFRGSEDQWHLVYDVELNSYSPKPATIEKFEILKKVQGDWQVLKSFSAEELKEAIKSPARNKIATVISPGSTAILFLNVDFNDPREIPEEISHRIVFKGDDPLNKPFTYEYRGAELKIDNQPPVRISPPLRGGKWVAVGGYAGKLGHRTAIFALDNALHSAQVFAIDWLRLDDKNYTATDTKTMEGSAAYGQPVRAVADGTIVGLVNKFKDQPLSHPEGADRLKWPGGNYIVQDIGKGYYAFYAHLKPGSIKVKEGEKVMRGQELGAVGNTGNSTGPHLHMHVTRNPGVLNADGVPYVFDEFEVLGEIKNLDELAANDAKAKQQHYLETKLNGTHKDELPREGHVIEFKGQ